MRPFLPIAFLALLAGCSAAGGARPNLVLIVSDDQGWDDVSCYGGSIPTPSIDSLATDGARFTDFYVSLPVCTPSRFSLLTGRLPNRSRDGLLAPLMFAEERDRSRGIRPGETTLAELLRRSGYGTALVGKWHLGHGDPSFLPTRHGFDSFYGHTGGCIDYHTLRYGNLPSWYRGEGLLDESGYATDLLTDEVARRGLDLSQVVAGARRRRVLRSRRGHPRPHRRRARGRSAPPGEAPGGPLRGRGSGPRPSAGGR